MKRFIKNVSILVLIVLLSGMPAFAARKFISKFGTSTSTTEVEFPADVNSTVLTNAIVRTWVSSEVITGWGHECGDYQTITNAATSSGQAVIPMTSTTGFATGETLFIQDKRNICSYEAGVIRSVSTTAATVVENLANSYSAGARVYEMTQTGAYYLSDIDEYIYENATNLFSVPEGSPMILRISGSGTSEISAAGYVGQ